MSDSVHQILELADGRIAQRKYAEAQSALNQLAAGGLVGREAAWFHLLTAEVELSLDPSRDLRRELGLALDFYKNSDEIDKLARTRYLQGRQFLDREDAAQAGEAFLDAYVWYKRCDNPAGQAKAAYQLSDAVYRSGSLADAIRYLTRAVELVAHLDDTERHLSVSIRLAQLYYLSGRLADSVAEFEKIPTILARSNQVPAALYFLESAVPLALRGDFAAARRTLAMAVPHPISPGRGQALYHKNFGWIMLLEADFAGAEQHLGKALSLAHDAAAGSLVTAEIEHRLGEICVHWRQLPRARQYAASASASARHCQDPVEIGLCHRLFAEIALADGDEEAARSSFAEALELLAKVGAEYELAITRYRAAQSRLFQSENRMALLYQAREYFQREAVELWVNEINALIGQDTVAGVWSEGSAGSGPFPVTASRIMNEVAALAERVATTAMAVFLTGATGTGKDFLARYLHRRSKRTGRFVALNSASIPDDMTEAELFGYRKGAFTGADRDKKGLIEEADDGTLYLNELADSSAGLQAKLLDVLERRTFRRLGEVKERKSDFRLITATNRDIEGSIREGRVRVDLYHRLSEVTIHLPPLNDRIEDIAELVTQFLAASGISREENPSAFARLVKAFCGRRWPGNVRQLKAETERLALMTKGDMTLMAEFALRDTPSERDRLQQLLEQTGWNRREVARILGISEMTVRRRIRKYRLDPDS